ncbi:MAG: N,N-dimethylformamidase beta subunit family domain-containing protein [Gaiellaceae bacterium]
MSTITAHLKLPGASRRLGTLVALVLLGASLTAVAVCLAVVMRQAAPGEDDDLDGRAPTAEELRPSVEAAFPLQSYAPDTRASLVTFNSARGVTVQLFHAGPELKSTYGNSEMQGVPVTKPQRIGATTAGRNIPVAIGNWPSGLYFARLTAADGRIGFAPFVLRPSRLGEHRIAVVMPTMTWQAYNLRDDNHDGKGDSWYADWTNHHARLGRPFLNRGVPYNFRRYDLAFLEWLSRTGKAVDVLADSDLAGAPSASALAAAYDLIVFPGHHEYVTTREYDLVVGYRDRGGHLAFLSANNFFWQIVKRGNVMERTEQWRNLGRPEAALIGVQYRDNDLKTGSYIVRDTASAPWLFAGTGLKNGSQLCCGGIEIDKTTSASPPGVKVLAEIPNLFGPGFTAQMTYYETANGAKVFAAGAFTLAGLAGSPVGAQLIANLWAYLSQPNRAPVNRG